MDKPTRTAIEKATQRARRLLEADFAEQLEGTYDVLPSGQVAAVGRPPHHSTAAPAPRDDRRRDRAQAGGRHEAL